MKLYHEATERTINIITNGHQPEIITSELAFQSLKPFRHRIRLNLDTRSETLSVEMAAEDEVIYRKSLNLQ